MATAKRYAFALPHVVGVAGTVWTASPSEGRPAVLLCGGGGTGERGATGLGVLVATRLARAGFTAVVLDGASESAGGLEKGLAATRDALARGTLVPGLAPPAKLVVLGYEAGVALARSCAARDASALAVAWSAESGTDGGEQSVSIEFVARGSHVVERSLQPGEALEKLLAWLARVM